jgi:acetoin utilization deacetylase AcuC-like enzyme
MTTAFLTDERCFWHSGGNYALTLPVGGLVQPQAAGGLPENPETKRRLKNLVEVTGLIHDLTPGRAAPASWEELRHVHPESYLSAFRDLSATGGGELGLRTPFGRDGFEIASLSAGLAIEGLRMVLRGKARNAYALSRPPGHHCLPDFPNGFCLLANIALAIHAARAEGLARRVAVVDWDVHHGNGTEAIFYRDPQVLTISLHQERNYPLDTGGASDRGADAGEGFNLNIPLPPGTGHRGYIEAMDRLVLPALTRFQPEVIIVACGYDASAMDPLGRMLASAETFATLTARAMQAATELCAGRLLLVHEGGYSEVHVPFCGHAVLQTLAGSQIEAPDPLADTLRKRQPNPQFDAFLSAILTEQATAAGLD